VTSLGNNLQVRNALLAPLVKKIKNRNNRNSWKLVKKKINFVEANRKCRNWRHFESVDIGLFKQKLTTLLEKSG